MRLRDIQQMIVLAEASMPPAEVFNRYYSELGYDLFSSIVSIDSILSKVSPDGQVQKIGKYARWLLNLLDRGYMTEEYADSHRNKIKAMLKTFDRVKELLPIEQRDINKYTSIDALEKSLEEAVKSEEISSKHGKKRREKEIETLYENNQYVVYFPKTYEACNKLGKYSDGSPTGWCTNNIAAYISYTESDTGGNLIVVVNKSNEDDRYLLHFERDEYTNANDDPINPFDLGVETISGIVNSIGTRMKADPLFIVLRLCTYAGNRAVDFFKSIKTITSAPSYDLVTALLENRIGSVDDLKRSFGDEILENDDAKSVLSMSNATAKQIFKIASNIPLQNTLVLLASVSADLISGVESNRIISNAITGLDNPEAVSTLLGQIDTDEYFSLSFAIKAAAEKGYVEVLQEILSFVDERGSEVRENYDYANIAISCVYKDQPGSIKVLASHFNDFEERRFKGTLDRLIDYSDKNEMPEMKSTLKTI